MTEQEFQTQVWRMYDKITTAGGVVGKVIGLNFTTKSVRAFISGAPEWIRCELIETHKSGSGKATDDLAIIQELHNTVLKQEDEIEKLKEENKQLLGESTNGSYLKRLLTAVNMMKEGLIDKKTKLEKVENGLNTIAEIAEKIESMYPNQTE